MSHTTTRATKKKRAQLLVDDLNNGHTHRLLAVFRPEINAAARVRLQRLDLFWQPAHDQKVASSWLRPSVRSKMPSASAPRVSSSVHTSRMYSWPCRSSRHTRHSMLPSSRTSSTVIAVFSPVSTSSSPASSAWLCVQSEVGSLCASLIVFGGRSPPDAHARSRTGLLQVGYNNSSRSRRNFLAAVFVSYFSTRV